MAVRGEDSEQFAAVVLAGGRARRLGGADKPGITIAGRTLVAVVAGAALTAGAGRVVVVGPRRPGLARELAGEGAAGPRTAGQVAAIMKFTCEQPPGSGPIPAVRAGLELVRQPWSMLLAADQPFLRERQLHALLAAAQAAGSAVLTDDQGRPQWLASCWRTAELRAVLASYRGSSLHGVLEPLRPAGVTADTEADQPPPWLDCDTAADIAVATDWARFDRTDREPT
ncbi:MAG TPA: NTP transferase domain-containing protein [Streptosporangiaceae bacterium]|nr:NTP transferase domain-containing protein [Streptosporangiaceae bacterium]